MKKFMNFLKNNSRKIVTIVTVAAVVGLAGTAFASFGPDRPTKAYTQGVAGFDHVTFNSFTGVPNIGDERNFLTGKIAGADGGFYDPMTKLRNNDEVMMRVYVHNNADSSLNESGRGVAKNTKVRVQLPSGETVAQNQSAKAFISADNAQPTEIFDTLDMKTEDNSGFAIKYIPGSAQVTSNEGTTAISDSVVAGGVNLGDEKGCFEFVKLITIKIKITAPDYTLEKTVRPNGSTSVNDWKKTMNVNAGDTVEWRLNFKNTGSTDLNDVAVVDNLPKGLSAVPGSVKLFDTNFPAGYQYPDSAIQANGRQINVNTGTRLPGVRAIVTFKTKIADLKDLECGVNTFKNVGFATPGNGNGTVTDDSSVTVEKECEEMPPVYECTSLSAISLGGNKYSFTTKIKAENGATVNKYIYNFGDASAELNTDKNVVEHQFTKPGEYNIYVRVLFNIGSTQKEARCSTKVVITTTPAPPTTPVTEIPSTGAGEVLAGLFGTSATAYAIYAWIASRRSLKNIV